VSGGETHSRVPVAASTSHSSTWWVVLKRELGELWFGGKALILILIYTGLLGFYSWLMATNNELNLLPLKEMVYEMVKAAIAVSMCICVIIAAESVSGERERATLEGLLLTPASRKEIVFGKFLAAVSPWPVAYAIAVPYWYAVSQGDPVFGRAALWGGVVGSVLAPLLAGAGMLVSIGCNTVKTSMVGSLAIYLLLLLPAILGGTAGTQRSYEQWLRAYLTDWLNPMAATNRFLQRILMDNWSPSILWIWFTMPVVAVGIVFVVLLQHGSPALRLEAEGAERLRPYWSRLAGLWSSAAGFASRSPSRG
jgi:ABC-2 type transport system permease protein